MVLTGLSLLFMLFVVASGASQTSPLKDTYFLQADTTLITGARATSQWTFFHICGVGNQNCGAVVPAIPFGYAWASHPSFAPADLIGDQGNGTTSSYYYYMWRFGWVFYLLAFIFNWISFFTGFMACFGRLGNIIAGLANAVTLAFFTLAVILMRSVPLQSTASSDEREADRIVTFSATFVNARNAFLNVRRNAQIGSYAFGFSWTAWIFLIIATVLFFLGAKKDRSHHSGTGHNSRRAWRRKSSPKGSTHGSRASGESRSKRSREAYA